MPFPVASSAVLLGAIVLSASYASAQNATGVSGACATLSAKYGDSLLYPTSANYSVENLHYWDIRDSDLASSCIFLPTTADQVADAVGTFSSLGAEFAVRGGGHMNVSKYTPIILFASETKTNAVSRLKQHR
jgi:hypothetical protein